MTFSRLAGWLVEPARQQASTARGRSAAAARTARAAAPPALALLGAPGDVRALGAALALRLSRGVAVVAVWGGGAAAPAGVIPATPAARRLSEALVARGMAALAAGRLVTAELGSAEAAASGALAQVEAAARAPAVLVAAGPRGDALDAVLVERDLVLVRAPDDALAELALSRLAEQGARAARLESVPGALARTLARAGLALPGGLGGLDAAAEAVR